MYVPSFLSGHYERVELWHVGLTFECDWVLLNRAEIDWQPRLSALGAAQALASEFVGPIAVRRALSFGRVIYHKSVYHVFVEDIVAQPAGGKPLRLHPSPIVKAFMKTVAVNH